jgi:hypothetical protein
MSVDYADKIIELVGNDDNYDGATLDLVIGLIKTDGELMTDREVLEQIGYLLSAWRKVRNV